MIQKQARHVKEGQDVSGSKLRPFFKWSMAFTLRQPSAPTLDAEVFMDALDAHYVAAWLDQAGLGHQADGILQDLHGGTSRQAGQPGCTCPSRSGRHRSNRTRHAGTSIIIGQLGQQHPPGPVGRHTHLNWASRRHFQDLDKAHGRIGQQGRSC
eukprot:1157376-Pelagomonas_calceolata.AAC.10